MYPFSFKSFVNVTEQIAVFIWISNKLMYSLCSMYINHYCIVRNYNIFLYIFIIIIFYNIFIDSITPTKVNDFVKKGYVVWNDNCQIPNISVYDKSVTNFIKKMNPPKCTSNMPMTNVILDVDTWTYTFKINYDFNSQISRSAVSCCYSSIVRSELKLKKKSNDDDRYQ